MLFSLFSLFRQCRELNITLVIFCLFTTLAACSDYFPYKKSTEVDGFSEDLRHDYDQLPQGYILQVNKVACGQNLEPSHLNLKLTFQDAMGIDESNIRSFYETQTFELASVSSLNNGLQLQDHFALATSSMEVLNPPGQQFANSAEDLADYPPHYTLSFVPRDLLRDNISEETPLTQMNQASFQGPLQKGGKTGKGKGKTPSKTELKSPVNQAGITQGTVVQNNHTPTQSPTTKHLPPTVQQKTSQPSVQQSPVQGKSPEQLKGPEQVQQLPNTPKQTVQQSPLQTKRPQQLAHSQAQMIPPVTTPGWNSTDHASNGHRTGYQLVSNSGNQNAPCQSLDQRLHQHLAQSFRPIYPAEKLSPYYWGYFADPQVIESESHIYYVYSKPTCDQHSWCQY